MTNSSWRQQLHVISDGPWQENKDLEENFIQSELLFGQSI